MGSKSKCIKITNNNTVLFGKDQVNSKKKLHLFGVQKESIQKLPNKALSEIAGSFLLLLLLPVSHQELVIFSLIPSIQLMVLSKCTSTLEAKKSALLLMIEFQFLILVIIIQLHTHQSIPSHLHKERGG